MLSAEKREKKRERIQLADNYVKRPESCESRHFRVAESQICRLFLVFRLESLVHGN